MKKETIAAISTAVSNSGIGIIRISGPEAIAAADRIYRSKSGKKRLADQPTHTIHYGYIMDGDETIDEVLVMLMRAPRTFTAEDTIEINCHGGVYAMRRVLETVLKNGVRPAEPGEFTKRAFLNGRIDLSSAEAVMDVIQAQNSYALDAAVHQLKGSVHDAVKLLRERLLYQTAFIEAALDDPEHISLDGYPESLEAEAEQILREIRKLISSADNGRLIREGIQTVIIGRPNAGKSSLMNTLLGEERAIVTEIEGTTRDILEETISIGGITLNVIDTAGIRDTTDLVEKIGVERALKKAEQADLILYVVDGSSEMDQNDRKILKSIEGKNTVILLNKSDLELQISVDELMELTDGKYAVIPVSAKEQSGIDVLENKLKELFYGGNISFNDEVCITSLRQKNLLMEAEESVRKVIESVRMGMPEDFYSIDLMGACEALGEITGESAGEDLVNEIFSRFCMGK